jgi:aspartate/tyrosine/aromatic aminotransferase
MSDFHEIVNDLASKGNDADVADVKVSLRKLGSLYDDMVAKVKVFGSENKDKRNQVESLDKENRELRGQISSLETQVKAVDDSPLKAELANLKASQAKWIDSEKQKLTKKLDGFAGHNNWDKAKDLLSVSQNEDGKFDLTKLTNDEVDALSAKVSEYETLGVFKSNSEPEPFLKPETFSATQGRVQPNGVNNPPEDLSDKGKVSDFISKELSKNLSIG